MPKEEQTMKKCISAAVIAFVFGVMAGPVLAEQFKIAIMQDQMGVAQKYKPLIEYVAKKGVEIAFISTKDYPSAAQMFAGGQVDAMFSGSGVAGAMIIKDLADPQVRPVGQDGYSTYWASIIAPKGAPKFPGGADYFNGKKVLLTSLASAGEFYFRSLPGADKSSAMLLKAVSHGAALSGLNLGQADAAIVKNRVWDKQKAKYPNLVLVGEDRGENPDGTLMASKKANPAMVAKVAAALLGLKNDASPEAAAVKASLEIQGYVKTTEKDFTHTLALLRNAGVTKTFNFVY